MKYKQKNRKFKYRNIVRGIFVISWLFLLVIINSKFNSYDKKALAFNISYYLVLLYFATVSLFFIYQQRKKEYHRKWSKMLNSLFFLIMSIIFTGACSINLLDNIKDISSGITEKKVMVAKRWRADRYSEKVKFVGDNREYNVFASDIELEPNKSYIVHIFPNTGRAIAIRLD